MSYSPKECEDDYPERRDTHHKVFCGCSDRFSHEKLYQATKELASKNYYSVAKSHEDILKLTKGDSIIFNGEKINVIGNDIRVDVKSRSGNRILLLENDKHCFFDFFGIWVNSNEHVIPYENVYIIFNNYSIFSVLCYNYILTKKDALLILEKIYGSVDTEYFDAILYKW